jgi:AcrR family transcriptional regulator
MTSLSEADARADRSKPASNSGSRSAAILNAAAHAIASGGIADLRVEQVAEEAGVSVALIYYHFGDRLGLAKAAFELASQQAPSTALAIASDGRSGYEALEAGLMAELDDSDRVRDAAIVWGEAGARAAYDPEFRPIVGEINRSWAETVEQAIRRGMDDGSIRSGVDPGPTAEILITLVDGLCIRWLAQALSLAEARDLLRGAIREYLLPAPGPDAGS